MAPQKKRLNLASRILIGMLLGLIAGLIVKTLPHNQIVNDYIVNGLFMMGGKVFMALLKMLVVPIVFVSLVCGTCHLGNHKLGSISTKVLLLFFITTAIAVAIGIICANLFNIGLNTHTIIHSHFILPKPISLKQTLLNLIPTNPFQAMANGDLLQIIIFSVLIGIAISLIGDRGKHIANAFNTFNLILMKLIELIMILAPYGVFCLIAEVSAEIGYSLISDLLLYCLAMTTALAIQLFGIYSILLGFFARLNPLIFYRKMLPIMLFGFGTSSSSASIPIMLETTEHQLGVNETIAAFTIPLGAAINKNGTAIMQGVASVFIAHLYHISLTAGTYATIIATATLASIGTAGIPGVGIITLAMVLQQAGLPLEGIGLLIGVDRLMDMMRTVINITGSAVTACVVSKSEHLLNENTYKTSIKNTSDL